MPFLDKQAQTVTPVTAVSTPTSVSLTANTAATLLAPGTRKAAVVKNTGTGTVTVSFGLNSTKTAYTVDLAPGASYLTDFAEVIPFSAISTVAGSVSIVELT